MKAPTRSPGRILAAALAASLAAPLAMAGALPPAPPMDPAPAAAPSSASSGVSSIVVTDATDLWSFDSTGAVYRIPAPGILQTIAVGPPLESPTGILYLGEDDLGNQEFIVSDIGLYYGLDDGALYLLGDALAPVTVFEGYPLSSPFGMLIYDDWLYVADYGEPFPGIADGAIYEFDLDPDDDGELGPFPLYAADYRIVYSGAPLEGPNEIVWLSEGNTILMGDDSGWLHEMDVVGTPMPIRFGPEFSDPAGLARSGVDVIVTD